MASDLSWSACESECSDLGASMLCVPDSTTNTWISDQLSQSNNYYYYGYRYYVYGFSYDSYTLTWIGYSDLPNNDGVYHWSSGCSSEFTNLGSSYNYDCFYLDSYDGLWYSTEDVVNYSITCSCEYSIVPSSAPTEAPSSPTTEPTSLAPMISPSVLPTFVPSINLCTTGWTLYNNNCYQFNVAYDLSWSACESQCSDLGASMLCIPDSTTNTWISDQLSQSYYYTWIGYSDLPNNDGIYHWSSGCSSEFTNLASSYNYDCFYSDYDGTWFSENDVVSSSITCSCEYSLAPSSEPTEAPLSSPTTEPTSLAPVISPSTLTNSPSYTPSVGESQQDSSVTYAIIIGVVVGAVAFCILFGFTLYYCFAREHNNKHKLLQVELSNIRNPVTDNVEDDEGFIKNAPDGVDVSTIRVKKEQKNQYIDVESLD